MDGFPLVETQTSVGSETGVDTVGEVVASDSEELSADMDCSFCKSLRRRA